MSDGVPTKRFFKALPATTEICFNCSRSLLFAYCTCHVCREAFCLDCWTMMKDENGVDRVTCWFHAGVGGAAAHQRHLRGVH